MNGAESNLKKIRKTINNVGQRDLEDRRAGWELTKEHGLHPFLLILANLLVYYFVNVRHGFPIENADNELLVRFGADFAPLTAKQPWRLFTAMFLHADFAHILGNMAALFFAGRLTHYFYGTKRFYLIYFAGGLLAEMVSPIFHPNSVCIGASGAVFAVNGAMLAGIAYRWTRTRMPLSNLAMLAIAYNVFNSLAAGLKGEHTNNAVHVSAIVVGGLLGYAMDEMKPRFADMRNATIVLLIAGFAGVYAGVYMDMKAFPTPQLGKAAPQDWNELARVVKTYSLYSDQIVDSFQDEKRRVGDAVAEKNVYIRMAHNHQNILKDLGAVRMSDREGYDFQLRLHQAFVRVSQSVSKVLAQPTNDKLLRDLNEHIKATRPVLEDFIVWYKGKFGEAAFAAVPASIPPPEEIKAPAAPAPKAAAPVVLASHEPERRLVLALMIFANAQGAVATRMNEMDAGKIRKDPKWADNAMTSTFEKTLDAISPLKMSDPESEQKFTRIRQSIARTMELQKRIWSPRATQSDIDAFRNAGTAVTRDLKDYFFWYADRYGKDDLLALHSEAAANPLRLGVATAATPTVLPTTMPRKPANFAMPSPAAAQSCRNSLHRYPRVSKVMLKNCAHANSYSALALDEYTRIYTGSISGGLQDTLLKVRSEAQLQCVIRAARYFSVRMTAKYLEDNCL